MHRERYDKLIDDATHAVWRLIPAAEVEAMSGVRVADLIDALNDTLADALGFLVQPEIQPRGAPSPAGLPTTPATMETAVQPAPLRDSADMARRLRVHGWKFKRAPLGGWVAIDPNNQPFGDVCASLDGCVRAAWGEDEWLTILIAQPDPTVRAALAVVDRYQQGA